MITEEEILRANGFSIREYLEGMGITPHLLCSTGAMYLSPIREERNPSFHVSFIKNTWYDFGIGKGGDLIALVRKMEGCDFSQAVQRILSGYPQRIIPIKNKSDEGLSRTDTIQITGCSEVQNLELLDYGFSRGISERNLKTWLKELSVHLYGRTFPALGFRNCSGGWEIRTPTRKMSSSPKDITHLSSGQDTLTIFEGFFDFLSYGEMENTFQTKTDFLVLNSVSMLKRSFPVMERYERIRLFLDNDLSGREALKKTLERFPQKAEDCSGWYLGSKDLNEALQKLILRKNRVQLLRQSQTGSFVIKQKKI